MCLNLQKAETSEALKNVLAEQAAQAAAAETGDKNTIDNVQKNALDIIKKVSGRKWDAWLSMKPMTISQAKKEFGRKFQNDLNAVIEEYSRSIGASEAKLKYNETLGQWMARLSKLAGKNGQ